MKIYHRLLIAIGLATFAVCCSGCETLAKSDVLYSKGYGSLEPGLRYVDENLQGSSRESWVDLSISFERFIEDIRQDGIRQADPKGYTRFWFVADDFDEQADRARNQLATGIADAMTDSGIWSRVKVSTEVPGARIKYRLIGRGMVTTSPELTNDVYEDMPIGYYRFWSERDGVRTGELEIVRVVDEECDVVIAETIP